MKTINIICIMQLSCLFTSLLTSGSFLAVDITNLNNTKFINVTPKTLANGGVQYVFRPRRMLKRIAALKSGNSYIPLNGKLKAKEVTLYKFKSMDLLKIPNPKPSVENRKYTKYLHFKKLGNKWQPLNLREFTYLFNTESMQAAILDMTGTDENIKVSMKKRDTKYYKPISKNVFVTKVTEGTHYIWPQDDQKGGIFLSASSKQKKNGQTHLHIKYKDIDKKKKDSYYMSDGMDWVQLDKKYGNPLINKHKEQAFIQLHKPHLRKILKGGFKFYKKYSKAFNAAIHVWALMKVLSMIRP
ncbi:hypothetical protein BdWA1_003177 [Babesia duncani]|uniref:Uncharacterized protein n=1 Tax=Babesia duncani TaxID=323732 RepID=A0AAD9PJ47_9APIC|nr:hypothetical protein BdWA1_003177 [Babesia duncani]